MKKTSQPHWVLQEIAEWRAPRATINLWLHIGSRLEDRPRERQIGMFTKTSRSPYAWMTATVILLVAVVVAVPQARASVSSFFGWAWNLLNQIKVGRVQRWKISSLYE